MKQTAPLPELGTFTKFPNQMKADRNFNALDKLVYAHMLQRYVFFSSKGNEYFDNQEEIAKALGVTRQTVATSIKTLEKNSLLITTKTRVQTQGGMFSSCKYVLVDRYKLYTKAKQEDPKWIEDDLDVPF